MHVDDLDLTIIIPAYNEEKRITKTLLDYSAYFDQNYLNYKILIVLNGCKDKTEDKVKEAQLLYPKIQYLVFPEPIGKGGALKKGFEDVQTDLIGYTDADGSTSPEMFLKLVNELKQNTTLSCVVGSRSIKKSVVIGKSNQRKLLSRGFNVWVNLLFDLGILDTQCGAKVMKKEYVKKSLPFLTISNMAFDINLLFSIKKLGGKTLEMPITWQDEAGSTIKNPAKTAMIMWLSVNRLRIIESPFSFVYYKILDPLSELLYKNLVTNDPQQRNKTDV